MSRRPEDEPDIQIGAAARAKKLRFNKKPETQVEFEKRGEANLEDLAPELEIQTASGSERENLPDDVEPGVTYRDVQVRWGAAAKIVPPPELEAEDEETNRDD
jgi:hypothetical protein